MSWQGEAFTVLPAPITAVTDTYNYVYGKSGGMETLSPKHCGHYDHRSVLVKRRGVREKAVALSKAQ